MQIGSFAKHRSISGAGQGGGHGNLSGDGGEQVLLPGPLVKGQRRAAARSAVQMAYEMDGKAGIACFVGSEADVGAPIISEG